jgi:hypothetical protein
MLVKSNHLIYGVLCDCVIFYSVIFCFFGDHKFHFVTTQLNQSSTQSHKRNKKAHALNENLLMGSTFMPMKISMNDDGLFSLARKSTRRIG